MNRGDAALIRSPARRATPKSATRTRSDRDRPTTTDGKPNAYGDRAPDDRLALVRICSHYFANGAWLEEGVLLRDAGRLAGIPGVLLHGRLDLGSPIGTAWELARARPTHD